MHDHHDEQRRRRGNWVFLGFVLIAGFLMFSEHRAHVLGVLPYLLLFACPLMHLFMHHGHHGHHGHHHHDTSNDSGQPPRREQ
ncbi:DUF2933 domain-containing protein [Aquitalea pelogenes]|uniref:DUF2933 domain-containing protein n=1 Tax=Aquitalea pelogenes TaxID=1293573 RepID=UPI0035B151D4